MKNERPALRIGQLAKAAGMTVRTLHHYEQLGLLLPPSRTEGRQRRYSEQDVRRLYVIRALRDLGLSLDEIRRTLRNEGLALGEVLRSHRERVDAELGRLQRLRAVLDHACAQAEKSLQSDELLVTLDAMSRVARRVEARRQPTNREEWTSLGRKLRARMEAGDEPTAPRVRTLAREALEGIRAFAGDQSTVDALAHLRKVAPPRKLAGWDPQLMRFLDRAISRLTAKEK